MNIALAAEEFANVALRFSLISFLARRSLYHSPRAATARLLTRYGLLLHPVLFYALVHAFTRARRTRRELDTVVLDGFNDDRCIQPCSYVVRTYDATRQEKKQIEIESRFTWRRRADQTARQSTVGGARY